MTDIFYFKYLDIPYNPDEIFNFFKNKDYHPHRFEMLDVQKVLDILPSIQNWFKSQGLLVTKVAYISTPTKFKQMIHTDVGDNELAINFPVFNCENTRTYFYKPKDGAPQVKVKYTPGTNLPYVSYEPEMVSEVCFFTLNKPVLLNVKKPHSIDNQTDNNRVSISFRFNKEPTHLI